MANNYERRKQQTSDFVIPLVEQQYDISIYGNDWWIDSKRQPNLLRHRNAYKGYQPYETLPSSTLPQK